MLDPAAWLVEHADRFVSEALPGPVLDLACGDGHNGLYLAARGVPVICCDISPERLDRVRALALQLGALVTTWRLDLEASGPPAIPRAAFGGILVFRYLHRPLIPVIKDALRPGGLLLYETYTVEQAQFGRPRNPAFLLKPGELRGWFESWEIIASFEGVRPDPMRAVAQIVCRKPNREGEASI